jgi:hypothetical protein
MKAVAQNFATNNVSPKIVAGLNGHALQPELRRLAAAFVDLQQARHEADYDTGRRFTRRETLDLLRLRKVMREQKSPKIAASRLSSHHYLSEDQ